MNGGIGLMNPKKKKKGGAWMHVLHIENEAGIDPPAIDLNFEDYAVDEGDWNEMMI